MFLKDEKSIDEIYDDIDGEWYLPEEEEGCLSGDKFDYVVTSGNEKIVFIKAGTGGSARGYEDKYVKMAERIHNRSGATVICASNPYDPICEVPDAIEIKSVANELGFKTFELTFVGISDGAYLNLELANQFSETVKWIGINPSYVEIDEFLALIKALPDVEKLAIIGTKNEDFDELVPALDKITCDNLGLKFIEGADHEFYGMLEEFIALSDFV
jgi:hypothetical protein